MMTTIQIAVEVILIAYLIYLSVYDIRYHKVRDRSLVIFLPLVCAKCAVTICLGSYADILTILLGSAAGFCILLLAAMLTYGGIGGGDIKLAAVLGLAAGLRGILMILLISSICTVLCGLIYRAVTKGRLICLPFVPFMTAGYILTLLLI